MKSCRFRFQVELEDAHVHTYRARSEWACQTAQLAFVRMAVPNAGEKGRGGARVRVRDAEGTRGDFCY